MHLLADSTFQPWQILCEERHYLEAVVWALSDDGGRLWQRTKNDVYIVDPFGNCVGDELKSKLLKEDWTEENISASHLHYRPSKEKGKIILKSVLFYFLEI